MKVTNRIAKQRDQLPGSWKWFPDRIAEMLGITRSYYSMLEAGTRVPSLPVALKIAGLYGVKVDDLFQLDPPMDPLVDNQKSKRGRGRR